MLFILHCCMKIIVCVCLWAWNVCDVMLWWKIINGKKWANRLKMSSRHSRLWPAKGTMTNFYSWIHHLSFWSLKIYMGNARKMEHQIVLEAMKMIQISKKMTHSSWISYFNTYIMFINNEISRRQNLITDQCSWNRFYGIRLLYSILTHLQNTLTKSHSNWWIKIVTHCWHSCTFWSEYIQHSETYIINRSLCKIVNVLLVCCILFWFCVH